MVDILQFVSSLVDNLVAMGNQVQTYMEQNMKWRSGLAGLGGGCRPHTGSRTVTLISSYSRFHVPQSLLSLKHHT